MKNGNICRICEIKKLPHPKGCSGKSGGGSEGGSEENTDKKGVQDTLTLPGYTLDTVSALDRLTAFTLTATDEMARVHDKKHNPAHDLVFDPAVIADLILKNILTIHSEKDLAANLGVLTFKCNLNFLTTDQIAELNKFLHYVEAQLESFKNKHGFQDADSTIETRNNIITLTIRIMNAQLYDLFSNPFLKYNLLPTLKMMSQNSRHEDDDISSNDNRPFGFGG